MYRAFIHQALAVLLSVVLAAGLATRVVQANAMGMTVSSAMDMPMHGKCDGCAGSEKAMAPMACGIYCAGMVALASPSVTFDPVFAGFVATSAEPSMAGHAFPPDPYPPRPTSMN